MKQALAKSFVQNKNQFKHNLQLNNIIYNIFTRISKISWIQSNSFVMDFNLSGNFTPEIYDIHYKSVLKFMTFSNYKSNAKLYKIHDSFKWTYHKLKKSG